MTATGRGARGDDGAGGATVRGALLVAAAVAVGVILLAKGFDGGTLPTSSETPSEQANGNDNGNDNGDGGDDGGDDASTTTTATPTTHVAAEVRVQVLNGGGPSGSAGTSSERLAAAQYTTLDAGNTEPPVPASVIYYAEGFQADAIAVGAALGITAAPQPMPTTPVNGAATAGTVDVVVLLGPDFTPPA